MLIDSVHEACGVAGVSSSSEAANARPLALVIYSALLALQHRGQEAAGIAIGDPGTLQVNADTGLVQQVFDRVQLDKLSGTVAIGHVRYSTSGDQGVDNAQPIIGTTAAGDRYALAHNGNMTLTSPYASQSEAISDTQRLCQILGAGTGSLEKTLLRTLRSSVSGAFSIVLTDGSRLIAARDRHGFRPLCAGTMPDGSWIVVSETAALDAVGANFLAEIPSGCVVTFGSGEPKVERFAQESPAHCSFEYIYFARPDSKLSGKRVHSVRSSLGQALAVEAPAEADVVVAVPDSARPAALAFAEAMSLRYEDGLVRNRYLGRTFIRPDPEDRAAAIRLKLNPVREVIEGRRVVLVDDSIVRGSSISAVVRMLRECGATEVHVRITSPPVRWPCFFGIDIKSAEELIAHQVAVSQLVDAIGADSVSYLSLAALERSIEGVDCCTGCFTGRYPE